MANRRRRRHARSSARRHLRRLLMLVLGLALGAGAAALFDSPLLHATPTAARPGAGDASNVDARRTDGLEEASRGQARSAVPAPAPRRPPVPVAGLTQAQMNNAATIVDVARARNLPRQAAVVAVATALQESNLRNLASSAVPASLKYPHEGQAVNYDSIGLFQQRASAGWGSVAQLMSPRTATGLFYDRLLKVPGWQNLSVTAAAQAVQRSAYPSAYQKHESRARQVVAALMA